MRRRLVGLADRDPALAHRLSDVGAQLVLVADGVDQPGRLGFPGREDGAVDRLTHLDRRQRGRGRRPAGAPTPVGDRNHQAVEHVVQDAVLVLAHRLALLVDDERLHRALELGDAHQIDPHAQVVQRLLVERHVLRHAAHRDAPRGMHDDAIAGAGQVHLARRRVHRVREDPLAAGAQRADQVAHLFDARDAQLQVFDLDDDTRDGVVGRHGPQPRRQRQQLPIRAHLGDADALDVAEIDQGREALAVHANEDAAAPAIAARGRAPHRARRRAAAQMVEVDPQPRGRAVVAPVGKRRIVAGRRALERGEGPQPVGRARQDAQSRRHGAPGAALDVDRAGADLQPVGRERAHRQLAAPGSGQVARRAQVLHHGAQRQAGTDAPARPRVEGVEPAVARAEDVCPADAHPERPPQAQRVGELELGARSHEGIRGPAHALQTNAGEAL